MFEINLWSIAVFVAWLVLWGLVFLIKGRLWAYFKVRIFTLLGVLLINCGFFLQPWIEFRFTEYIVSTPDIMRQLIPEQLVELLIKRFGHDWFEHIFRFFCSVTSLNGLKLEAIPTLSFWTRLWTVLPFLLSLAVMAALVARWLITDRNLGTAAGAGLAVLSLFELLALLLALPNLDALDLQGNFQWMLLTGLLGTELGNGPWFTIAGLLLFIAGGLYEVYVGTQAENSYDPQDEYPEWLPSSY